MAKIKIFEGAGPNPNVSFTNLAPSRYAGQTGDAVAKVANNFTQQAIKYAELQKRQSDVAQEVQATGEKQKFVANARANALQPDGTYDVATLEKALTDFDGQLKQSISKDAYQSYSLKESQKNAHMIATAQNDNLKITRKNNRSITDQGLNDMMNSSIEGSLEDKMIAFNDVKETVAKAVATGIYGPDEVNDKLDKLKFSFSKGYLENLLKSEDPSAFSVAQGFVEKDPYDYYKGNQIAKTNALNSIAKAQDDFEAKAESDYTRKLNLRSKLENNQSKALLGSYTSEILKGYNDGNGGEIADDVFERARQDLLDGKIKPNHYKQLTDLSPKLAESKDVALRAQMYADPNRMGAYYGQLSDYGKEKYKKDFEKLSNAPGAFKESQKVFKEATKSFINWGSAKQTSRLEQARLESSFMDNTLAASQSKTKFDTNLVILKTIRDNLPPEKYNEVYTSMTNEFYLKLRKQVPGLTLDEASSTLNEMIGDLDNAINEINSKPQGSAK